MQDCDAAGSDERQDLLRRLAAGVRQGSCTGRSFFAFTSRSSHTFDDVELLYELKGFRSGPRVQRVRARTRTALMGTAPSSNLPTARSGAIPSDPRAVGVAV